MNIPDYSSEDFAKQIASKTFCGTNAWLRLMSWLDVDKPFQKFMESWKNNIAPFYHQEQPTANNLPNIDGLLESHFEELYPSQFILRLFQITNNDIRTWLLTSLNKEQQEVLYYWHEDSKTDYFKGKLADNWLEAYKEEKISFNGTPIFKPLNSDIIQIVSQFTSKDKKRIR